MLGRGQARIAGQLAPGSNTRSAEERAKGHRGVLLLLVAVSIDAGRSVGSGGGGSISIKLDARWSRGAT
jgi:hypothetical protein